jgi:hypothetical protein
MLKNILILGFILSISVNSLFAQESKTISTLLELKVSQETLNQRIKEKNLLLKKATTDEDKAKLKLEITSISKQISTLQTKFEKIATGIDISIIKSEQESKTTLTDDFQLLLKPLVQGAKQATEDMRKKAQLQEEIEHYHSIIPQLSKAYQNLSKLSKMQTDKKLKKEIQALEKYWQQQLSLTTSNLNATQYQLKTMEENEISFSESIHKSTKNFFQQRGLVLFEGVVAFLTIFLLLKMFHSLLIKFFPILNKANRSFKIRIFDLLYRLFATILALLTPMIIFYHNEDWLLFSIGLLILFSITWTFRNFLPKLWQQVRLLLNIGSVRENERIYYHNLPWRVTNINLFTILENPTSKIKLRIPIEQLIGLISRPIRKNEPWFPCREDDWVLLGDNTYGKVTGISLEFIEIITIGGSRNTYLVSDFLALSPQNFSTNFRILEVVGISYNHQKESTNQIIDELQRFVLEVLKKEGYFKGINHLVVRFSSAGDSSLNLEIVADFKAEMAPFYYDIRSSIAKAGVDACTKYGWEIPFPQLDIHNKT